MIQGPGAEQERQYAINIVTGENYSGRTQDYPMAQHLPTLGETP